MADELGNLDDQCPYENSPGPWVIFIAEPAGVLLPPRIIHVELCHKWSTVRDLQARYPNMRYDVIGIYGLMYVLESILNHGGAEGIQPFPGRERGPNG